LQLFEIFGTNGVLEEKIPGYEPRDDQLLMAEKIGESLINDGQLVVEAATGIGKTLAYLVPAVLSGQKIIVSTGTLNLQEQIFNQEIPLIKKYIDPELSALCLKGRQNYLCFYRYSQWLTSARMSLIIPEEVELIENWLEKTEFGDRAELTWLEDDSAFWFDLSANSSQCLGIHCPDGYRCFLNKLRRSAARARILIVNHHLFFSDLALRRFGFAEVLPRYQSVIFDEAHHLEDVATRYFGISFSHYQLLDLTTDLIKCANEWCTGKEKKKIKSLTQAITSQANDFFTVFPEKKGRFPLTGELSRTKQWQVEGNKLINCFKALIRQLEILFPTGEIWQGMLKRAEEQLEKFQVIAFFDKQQTEDDFFQESQQTAEVQKEFKNQNSGFYQNSVTPLIRWYERRERTITLSASPLEIGSELNHSLYPEVKGIIFTSATLTVAGSFDYFFSRMELSPDTDQVILGTPFDYQNQTRLYIPPKEFPEPSHPDFSYHLGEKLLEITRKTRGRALLLFTSFKMMREMSDYLQTRISYPVLIQGQAPKARLLELFQEQTDSVLFAVASFWEGVNVAGESLSCVIIDKLPFEVPSDPVIMARLDKIRQENGNPFFDFQVPRAILTLRQGIGRLMRSSSDYGLLAVMDVRLFTKSYGRLFRKSLPPSPIIRKIGNYEL
jgi:ATP-dependent DNA helicase DinG